MQIHIIAIAWLDRNISATIVHSYIHFRKQIRYYARRSIAEQADIHARLMSRYPQVPEWYVKVPFVLNSIQLHDAGGT